MPHSELYTQVGSALVQTKLYMQDKQGIYVVEPSCTVPQSLHSYISISIIHHILSLVRLLTVRLNLTDSLLKVYDCLKSLKPSAHSRFLSQKTKIFVSKDENL